MANQGIMLLNNMIDALYEPKKIPRIDIAVVGDTSVGKTSIIKFWLSLNIETIVASGVYSKVIWMDDAAVQMCIHEISPLNRNKQNLVYNSKKYYHTVVYVYDLNNNDTWKSIPGWIDFMRNRINYFTYQMILGLSDRPNEELDFESDKISKIRKKYVDRRISYHIHSSQPSESLSRLIGEITTEAYDIVMRDEALNFPNFLEKSDTTKYETIEMDIFNKNIESEPLLLRGSVNQANHANQSKSDLIIYPKNHETDCCVIM